MSFTADCDIYGPSLPTMMDSSSEEPKIQISKENYMMPLTFHGIKCMSYGFWGNTKAAMVS